VPVIDEVAIKPRIDISLLCVAAEKKQLLYAVVLPKLSHTLYYHSASTR